MAQGGYHIFFLVLAYRGIMRDDYHCIIIIIMSQSFVG